MAQIRRVLTTDTFEDVMIRVISAVHQETDAKLAALEARLAEFAFKGTWSEGHRYRKRNLVSMGGGAVYVAVVDTDMRPGVSPDWALLVPKPKDGRDGRDAAEPPEQRTVKGERALQDSIVRRR